MNKFYLYRELGKLIIPYLIGNISAFSQTFGEFTLKEQFDAYNANRIAINYNPCTIADTSDQGTFGDGMCYVLEGYINMYKTTRDKGYLYKLIKESLCMMENRNDYAGLEVVPRWSPNMYHNGNIVAGMSRFVHFVKLEEPDLFSELLYPFPEFVGANEFGLTFTTFGEYANWIQDRCGETIWWFLDNGYWIDDYGFGNELSLGDPGLGDDVPTDINQQAGFSRAMLFIGLSAGESSFLEKAIRIAELYRENVVIHDICDFGDPDYDAPMMLLTTDNSYWWYQKMWGYQDDVCGEFVEDTKEFIEDMSHAALVTSVPLDFYQYQPLTPFTLDDMIRYRNMFTKHVYNGIGGFNDCINGTDEEDCARHGDSQDDNIKLAPLAYMRFSEFEGADVTAGSPDVYDIIMAYYLNVMYNVGDLNELLYSSAFDYPYYETGLDYIGTQNRGHSEMVAEQWERECPDLTLFSRHVVYDQGFYAKGMLTLDPAAPPALGPGVDPGPLFEPYADPKDVMSQFVVDPGVQSSITAVNGIHLKSGVHFSANSKVHVYIDDEICTDGFGGFKGPAGGSGSLSLLEGRENKSEISGASTYAVNNEHELSIVPNPNNGSFTILGNVPLGTNFEMYICDATGKTVFSGQINPGEIFEFSRRAGVYFVNLTSENFSSTLRWVVQ